MRAYLGIDIGTFEAKGVLVDSDGVVLASTARPHKMLSPQPGWAEHRPIENWWNAFTSMSRDLMEHSKVAPTDIKAIGTSAIGPCMLPVDDAGEPLMNAVLYSVDSRATREIEDMTAAVGEATILERCGNILTTQSVGPKILWLKRHRPDLFYRAARIVTSTTFLVERLTGVSVIDHYTAANWSPLYDVGALDWCEDLAPGLIGRDRLPRLAWSTEIAGAVTAQAAAETGLAAGTPVIAGTVDAAAEALSVGVLDIGDMMLMYGSAIFMIEITRARVRDPRLWSAPWIFPDQYAAMASLATSGTITHWFRNQFARELDPATGIASLAAEAAQSPPGARGLVMLPYFAGAQTPIHDANARGALFGLDLSHTRADMFRAVLEGVGYGVAHIFDTYRDVGQMPKTILAVGGGTRNRAWTQAVSDITGMNQTLRERTVGASYGDAFLAAHAIGDVPLDRIQTWNHIASTIAPDIANEATYRRQYEIYRALSSLTQELSQPA
jgi:xylulokinase